MNTHHSIRTGLLGACLATALAGVQAATPALERIKTAGSINFGYVEAAPFSSLGGKSEPSGYTIELCKRVAESVKAKLGLANMGMKYVPVTPQTVTDMVAKGEVDLLCTPAVDTLKWREKVSFSIPVFNGGIGAAVRKDADPTLLRVLKGEAAHSGPTWRATINRGLANHTYAVRAGTVSEDFVRAQIKRLGVIATVVEAKDDTEGLQMLIDHKANAYFSDRTLLEEYTSQSKDHDKLLVVDRNFTEQPLALMMGRNDDDFRLAVDAALSNFYRSAEFRDLYERYFGPFGKQQTLLFQVYARP